jgi:drug/metabolite transporter (DMT)-like permease
VVWGSTYLAIAVAIETIPPFLMAGTRFLVAGGLLLAVARWRGEASPTRREWAAGAVGGLLLMVGGNGAVTWAEKTVPSGTAALMVATCPVWITLIDWRFFRGPRPTLPVLAGLAVGLAGVAVLVDASVPAAFWGMVALTVSPLSWAFGTLYGRTGPMPRSPLLSSAVQMLTGGVLLGLLGSAAGEWTGFDVAAVSARSLAALLVLALVGSVVTFSAYIWLVRHASPTAVSTYSFVNPVVAVLLGWAVLDEPVGPRTGVATALIVLAVALVLLGRRR